MLSFLRGGSENFLWVVLQAIRDGRRSFAQNLVVRFPFQFFAQILEREFSQFEFVFFEITRKCNVPIKQEHRGIYTDISILKVLVFSSYQYKIGIEKFPVSSRDATFSFVSPKCMPEFFMENFITLFPELSLIQLMPTLTDCVTEFFRHTYLSKLSSSFFRKCFCRIPILVAV
jgi:hypothetical protein